MRCVRGHRAVPWTGWPGVRPARALPARPEPPLAFTVFAEEPRTIRTHGAEGSGIHVPAPPRGTIAATMSTWASDIGPRRAGRLRPDRLGPSSHTNHGVGL